MALQYQKSHALFSLVLDLSHCVWSATIDQKRNPHCVQGIQTAVDRMMQLLKQNPINRIQLYHLNLALRAMVYDLEDTQAISHKQAKMMVLKSLELEQQHLARNLY